MSSHAISLGQSLNQAIFGATQPSGVSSLSSTGKPHGLHEGGVTSSGASHPSDPASALMQAIQQALTQTGVSTNNSTTGVDGNPTISDAAAAQAQQAGTDSDGDHDGSAGGNAVTAGAPALHQLMHTLVNALNSVQGTGTNNLVNASQRYSTLESNLQSLLGQFGSQASNASGASHNPALQTLGDAFQKLVDANSAPNANPTGIPTGFPGTQPTLQVFLQNLASDLTKGSFANAGFPSIGGLVSATA